MNRIDRLTAILIHLQSKRVVRAQDLADRFSISLRTVYRDIRSLEEAGVPIGAEAGVGYFLDGYHLPPVMFTNAEASALVFGAKLVERMADLSLREPFESALFKVKSVLKKAEKEHLDELEPLISVSNYRRPTPFSDQLLNQIQSACVQQQVLVIDYQTPYNTALTTREVEPIGLYHYSSGWHLIAFCRLRQDYRDFRTDRIRQMTTTGKLFSRQSLLSLQGYLDRMRASRDMKDLTEAVIWFDKRAARFTEHQRLDFGFLSEEVQENRVKMIFLTQYPEGLARWLMMFGNGATIDKPVRLKQLLISLADEISAHHGQPQTLLT
ncbi:helix-turn-helix transcriptional regulator [Fibrella forsythiae]|uniref:YafY family transcriptional regulator n=1 Tax=Fibrella forsythiae TaxID=2817061 RepID=A0ABS3JB09_9BACT|nr:YafY family protein [Fibrella forsythiae]MBO0947171.1 YafY family transcriptional regulator [Fibrella forsythiae]